MSAEDFQTFQTLIADNFDANEGCEDETGKRHRAEFPWFKARVSLGGVQTTVQLTNPYPNQWNAWTTDPAVEKVSIGGRTAKAAIENLVKAIKRLTNVPTKVAE